MYCNCIPLSLRGGGDSDQAAITSLDIKNEVKDPRKRSLELIFIKIKKYLNYVDLKETLLCNLNRLRRGSTNFQFIQFGSI